MKTWAIVLIIVGVFLILPMSMVILKMFSSQITDKRSEIMQAGEEEWLKQARADLNNYCNSLCSDAQMSMKNKIAFCTGFYDKGIDINRNGASDYIFKLDNLHGYCEDRVYCSAYSPCAGLNLNSCRAIVCNYMEDNLNMAGDQELAGRLVGYEADGSYSGLFQPGDCYSSLTDEQKETHWFTRFMSVPNLDSSGQASCFFAKGTCYDAREDILNDPIYSPGGVWDSENYPCS